MENYQFKLRNKDFSSSSTYSYDLTRLFLITISGSKENCKGHI